MYDLKLWGSYYTEVGSLVGGLPEISQNPDIIFRAPDKNASNWNVQKKFIRKYVITNAKKNIYVNEFDSEDL